MNNLSNPSVTVMCSPGLTQTNSMFSPDNMFICFVCISEQTAFISLYNINWLVFITETECVYCVVRTGYLYTILRFAHTVYLCVLCGSENKQRLFPYTTLTDWFFFKEDAFSWRWRHYIPRNVGRYPPDATPSPVCHSALTLEVHCFS